MNYTQQKRDILKRMMKDSGKKSPYVVAIDGRCASGKSTLAEWIASRTEGTVFHLDDYFLRPEQRTKERFEEVGGNVDYERFLKEILEPIGRNQEVTFQPFNCQTMSLEEPIVIQPKPIVIVEGSYAMRKEFQPYYDLTIFMTVDAQTQLERIQVRNPDRYEMFQTKWIPFEERYFSQANLEDICDFIVNTTESFQNQ